MKKEITKRITKICQKCGKEFLVAPWYGKGIFCSRTCADNAKVINHQANITCDNCGKRFYKKPSQIKKNKHHFCSMECLNTFKKTSYKGKNNPNYNKRKEKVIIHDNKNKYYELYIENHPFGHSHNGNGNYYKEHRYVVEQNHNLFDDKYFIIINKNYYLKPEIEVHHKNENTLDNRIENLQPLTKSEHKKLHCKNQIILRNFKNGRIIGVLKRGELLENHITSDNQQPSFSRNTIEGSTTNNRVLTCNDEDSNIDTSAPLTQQCDDDIV